MRSILLVLVIVRLAIALLLAEDATNFPSPDGKLAFSMGSYETGHRDSATQEWIIDSETKPGAIIDQASHKVLLQLESPLRQVLNFSSGSGSSGNTTAETSRLT